MMQLPAKLNIFLHCAPHDYPIAKEVYQRLKIESWINPWLISEDLGQGVGTMSQDLQMDTAMFSSDIIMVFTSGNLDYQKVLEMLNTGKPIVILRLDKTPLPFALANHRYIDFFPVAKRSAIYIGPVLDWLNFYARSFGISISARSQFQDVDLFNSPPIRKPKTEPRRAVDEPITAPEFHPSQQIVEEPAKSKKPAVKSSVKPLVEKPTKSKKPADKISDDNSVTKKDRSVTSSLPIPKALKQLKVFLCHSSHDKAIVNDVYNLLNAEGWIDPWLDQKKLLPGQDWSMEIEKAVESSHIVLVFLTNNSVNKEGYIQRELRLVLDVALNMPEETIFVIPFRLEACELPRRLRSWHWLDYFPAAVRSEAYERLLVSLRIRAEKLGIATE